MATPTNHSNKQHKPATDYQVSYTAWITCITAALFFLYEFTQMNFINSISQPLISAFHLDSVRLGILGSAYLLSNVIFLLPAGAILDKFSVRKVILTTLGLCIFGTLLLSFSHSYVQALICRFATGIGGAFCLVSCIRLATHWFPQHKMAKVTSIIIFIAMLGGMLSQTPVAILARHMSWQHILLINALIGCVFWVLIAVIVRDGPKEAANSIKREHKALHQVGVMQSLYNALRCKNTWIAGVYTSFMNLPLSLFGITWGVLLLSTTHNLSTVHASEMTSLMFLGTIIGCPVIGWISDYWRCFKLPMAIGAIISLLLMLYLLYASNLSTTAVGALCLLLGFTTSTQILGYPVITATSPKEITATSISLGSLLIMGSQAIAQPLFGYLIDHHGHTFGHAYVASNFSTAIIIFPVVLVISFILVLLLPKIQQD